MTTVVTIAAHIPSNKKVEVTIKDNDEFVEYFTMQAGQIVDRAVYDGREISVKEVDV